MHTEIRNAVTAADEKAQYDEYAKRLLAQKYFLAHILVKTVDEFNGMEPEAVVKFIEGEPQIEIVPTEPGLTNKEKIRKNGQRIVGLNTENSEIGEGLIRFDILFYVRLKDGLSQIIINVEAQKGEPTAYKILNRAVFYVSRLISSQKERDFVGSNYDDIKRVFSIWICMNMDINSMSFIHLMKEDHLEAYKWSGNLDLLNIVLIGITNDIPAHEEKYELHRLLSALFSTQLVEQEKLEIIGEEYKIPLTEKERRDVKLMCNLSEGIEEKALEKGKAEGKAEFILNMYKEGFSLEQIARVAKLGVEEIETIIKKETQS